MARIVVIGECRVDIDYDNDFKSARTSPAGLMTGISLKLAALGRHVLFLSEVANDTVGNSIIDYMGARGIDTSCIDCYTDGLTPAKVSPSSGSPSLYTRYPDSDGFDIIWPRLDDKNDIVIFGDYMTLSQRWSRNFTAFMNHVGSKGCHVVYIPGDISWREPRVTKVMPRVFENLERADAVVLDAATCLYYFGTDNPATALKDTVEYYCRSILFIESDGSITVHGSRPDAEIIDAVEAALR